MLALIHKFNFLQLFHPYPAVISLFHYSQNMLVMSESRLKIQITSGTDIKTKDQDTPLTDHCSLVIIAPNNPALALGLPTSSSCWCFVNNNIVVRHCKFNSPCCTLTRVLSGLTPHLDLASWLNAVACNKFEKLIHHDDRN